MNWRLVVAGTTVGMLVLAAHAKSHLIDMTVPSQQIVAT